MKMNTNIITRQPNGISKSTRWTKGRGVLVLLSVTQNTMQREITAALHGSLMSDAAFSWRTSTIDEIYLQKQHNQLLHTSDIQIQSTPFPSCSFSAWTSHTHTLGHFVRGVKGVSHDNSRFGNRVCDGFMRQNIGTVDVEFIVHDHILAQNCDVLHPHLTNTSTEPNLIIQITHRIYLLYNRLRKTRVGFKISQ